MKKKVLVVLGFICLALGIIGIVIPILPTTPFLLLAAACFFRGSNRAYRWLMQHKLFGDYIRNFREYRAIPLKTKIIAITLLWTTILISIFFIVESVYLRLLLGAIAVAVTAHILRFNTLPSGPK